MLSEGTAVLQKAWREGGMYSHLWAKPEVVPATSWHRPGGSLKQTDPACFGEPQGAIYSRVDFKHQVVV